MGYFDKKPPLGLDEQILLHKIFSGFFELPAGCIDSQFVCFRPVPSIIVPLVGKIAGNIRLMDAYRFCEARRMKLFKPDTKAKNLFLAKMSLALNAPILFDLYRFGNKFEFQYGLGSSISINFGIALLFF